MPDHHCAWPVRSGNQDHHWFGFCMNQSNEWIKNPGRIPAPCDQWHGFAPDGWYQKQTCFPKQPSDHGFQDLFVNISQSLYVETTLSCFMPSQFIQKAFIRIDVTIGEVYWKLLFPGWKTTNAGITWMATCILVVNFSKAYDGAAP